MVDVEWGSLTSLFFVLSFLAVGRLLSVQLFPPEGGRGGIQKYPRSTFVPSSLPPSLLVFFCSANNMQSLYEQNSSAHAALLHWNTMQKKNIGAEQSLKTLPMLLN